MAHSLIVSTIHDVHALAVHKALELKGHRALILYPEDFPTRQSVSFHLSNGGAAWGVRSGHEAVTSASHVTSVWLRRVPGPSLTDAQLHPADREIARKECGYFTRNLFDACFPDSFHVNHPDRRHLFDCKLSQLQLARRCGLPIPDTLLSNDPAEIRRFMREHHGGTLFKTFTPNVWTDGASTYYTYATVLGEEQLPDDDTLRLTPGIFQRVIDSPVELRVVGIGSRFFAGEIHYEGVDYRKDVLDLPVAQTTLPAELEVRLRNFMRHLGVGYASFDFMRDRDGTYYFLEANPSGQWLWVEWANPAFKLLDAFSEMMIQGTVDYAWEPSRHAVSFRDVLPRIQHENASEHARPKDEWVVREHETSP